MANNRLYLKETTTGEKVLLAKSWGSGWVVYRGEGLNEGIQRLFDRHPFDGVFELETEHPIRWEADHV